MVSLWPWKGEDSSAASFEKTLSTLSARIATLQAQLDKQRSSSRRMRVLVTLYMSLAYLIYAVVAFLLVGSQKMGPYEWSGVAGGPVLIYLVRLALGTWFNFRIDGLASRLKDQQQTRAKTIQKLKDATRYDSTMELLEKYGGDEGTPKGRKSQGGQVRADTPDGKKARQSGTPAQGGNRTNLPIPPTANIQRQQPSAPTTPQSIVQRTTAASPQPRTAQSQKLEPSADFAPNAFEDARSFPGTTTYGPPQNHWYDRVMDLLLGEDEAATKNRYVLVCQKCRLVNGQAPPGTKSMADMGLWKCMACGAMNGEMDEGEKIVKQVLEQAPHVEKSPSSSKLSDDDDSGDLVEVDDSEEADTTLPENKLRQRKAKSPR